MDADYNYVRDKNTDTSAAVDTQTPKLKVDDYVAIEVMNLGDRDVYVSVLDLTSDGEVAQLWPDRKHPITDNFVTAKEKGQWVRLWTVGRETPAMVHITEPLGLEIFKLIATSEHADLNALGTRWSANPMETLFKALAAGTRAGNVPPPRHWFTDEFVFVTEPR